MISCDRILAKNRDVTEIGNEVSNMSNEPHTLHTNNIFPHSVGYAYHYLNYLCCVMSVVPHAWYVWYVWYMYTSHDACNTPICLSRLNELHSNQSLLVPNVVWHWLHDCSSLCNDSQLQFNGILKSFKSFSPINYTHFAHTWFVSKILKFNLTLWLDINNGTRKANI